MKSLRIVLLSLLIAVLPARGTMAGAVWCPPTAEGRIASDRSGATGVAVVAGERGHAGRHGHGGHHSTGGPHGDHGPSDDHGRGSAHSDHGPGSRHGDQGSGGGPHGHGPSGPRESDGHDDFRAPPSMTGGSAAATALAADGGAESHDLSGSGAPCWAFCLATPMASTAPALPAPPPGASAFVPADRAPAPDFETGRLERPPRSS